MGAPWVLLDSKKQGASHEQQTRPPPRDPGRIDCEDRGREGGWSPASGFFPRVLPEEDSSQDDLSPGRQPQLLWPSDKWSTLYP